VKSLRSSYTGLHPQKLAKSKLGIIYRKRSTHLPLSDAAVVDLGCSGCGGLVLKAHRWLYRITQL